MKDEAMFAQVVAGLQAGHSKFQGLFSPTA